MKISDLTQKIIRLWQVFLSQNEENSIKTSEKELNSEAETYIEQF